MAVLAAVLLTACSTARESGSGPAGPATQRLSMQVLDGSRLAGGQLRLGSSPTDAGLRLTVEAESVTDLHSAYLSIRLPQGNFRLLEARHAGLDELSPLSLSLLHDGQLHFGWTKLHGGEAWSGDGLLAGFELERVEDDVDAGGDSRTASKAVPAVDDLSRNAKWNILSWSYLNPGDYDQNGIVSISDLTPLGQNFGATGPFDPSSAMWVVDGDGNGEINLADISVIGQNFGNSVTGYDLYASPDGMGHPDTGGARLVASISTADSLGGASDRRHFRYTDLDVQLDDRYWVLPTGGSAASPLTDEWEKQWHLEHIYSIPIDGGYGTGGLCLSVVDGIPCMAFAGGGTNREAYFCRAMDAVGSQWDLPVIVPMGFQFPRVSAVVEQDSKPALFGGDNNLFALYRALDAHGTSWDNPVPVVADSRGSTLEFVHEGQLCTLNRGTNTINLSCGNSAVPSTFDSDLLIADVYTSRVAYHGGRLAIAYHDLPADKGYFRVADIISGNISTVIFNEPETSTDFAGIAGLMYFQDRPYLWTMRDFGDELFQMRSADGSGMTWNAPVQLDFGPGYFTGMDVIEAYGQMFMLNRGWDEYGIECRTNIDGGPQNWLLHDEMFEDRILLPWADLQVVRGHPATVVLDDTANSLDYYYARFY